MPKTLSEKRKVFVLGGGGYLGSVLVPMLIRRGYHVVVVDRFFFGKETLSSCSNDPNCVLIEGDTRSLSQELFREAYGVIDLAALSNDPLAELNPQLTHEINFQARAKNADLAKKAGAERYILASSCSVYGCEEGLRDETSSLSPLTVYAKMNVLAEERTLSLQSSCFTVTVLRQGTLYGVSPRMRFDLVVNAMTLSALRQKKINIYDGSQWRPLLHVADSAQAFLTALEAPKEKIGGEIFNVGATEHNFQVETIASLIATALQIRPEIFQEKGNDSRSYRVSCAKIRKTLGYMSYKTPQEGAREVALAFSMGTVRDSLKTKTVEWYRALIKKDPMVLQRTIIQL